MKTLKTMMLKNLEGKVVKINVKLENYSREIETKEPIENSRTKNVLYLKHSLDGFNSRLDIAEEKICEFEGRSIEMM